MSVRVGVVREGATATVSLGSGQRGNALSSADWRELAGQLRRLADDPGLRVVTVRGTGPVFSAGSDMREWVHAEPADIDASFTAMESAFVAVEALPVPVVAEIRGVAAGAGCQLALACDLRIMADSARIGMPIARLGILASAAFAARIVAVAGPDTARELLYTGRLLAGPEAARRGLAGRSVPDDALGETVSALAGEIAAQPPAAIRAAKRAVAVATSPVRQAASEAADTFGGHSVALEDFRTGVGAFLRRHQASSEGG